MFRKYTLIFLAAVVFCPGRASAQTTMDAVMKLQAMLNTLSEARGTIEKIASSENFMSMTKNLGNPAKLMETLKNPLPKPELFGKAAKPPAMSVITGSNLLMVPGAKLSNLVIFFLFF